MNPYDACCFCTILFLKRMVDLGSFICICILCHSSRKDPFDTHFIGNMTNYFFHEINYKNNITNQTEYNNSMINSFSSGEHLFNESKILSSEEDTKKMTLRQLVAESFCSEIQENFEKYKGTKLSNIFDLNYGKIHKISIATLVVSCTSVFSGFLNICFLACHIQSNGKYPCFIFLFSCFILLLDVAKFILTIILVYFME